MAPSDPQRLYAAVERPRGIADLYMSEDGGDSWNAFDYGLTDLFIEDLAINPLSPSTLYAGTNGDGVFSRTQDQIFKSGFENNSHFGRSFKSKYGMSPSKFRMRTGR